MRAFCKNEYYLLMLITVALPAYVEKKTCKWARKEAKKKLKIIGILLYISTVKMAMSV